ncbi:PqqD family protein [Treponema sp.]|uniref:PqqD family protein n=1 Tax=Treponema sp. TaxID=166 RepID=UPI003890C1FB
MMKHEKQNYVDIVFRKNDSIEFEKSDDGSVTLFVENKGFFNRLMQKLLNKPRISQVHLEEFGSFIWMEIDGKKTLISISEEVHKEFGEKAEPLLPRLVQYFRILENNSFITRCGK